METQLFKLAWIGAQGSGKTTTVNRVSRMLSDMRIPNIVVAEKARLCKDPLQTFKAQEWMVHEQIRDEEFIENYLTKFDKDPKVVMLCDRSIWDSLVYMTYMCRKGMVTDAEFRVVDSLISDYAERMLTYDKIYFCEIKVIYDDYQTEIQNIFKEVIKERGIRVTVA